MDIFKKIVYRFKSEINSMFAINGTMQQFFAGIGLYFLMLYIRAKYRIWFFIFKKRNKNKRWLKRQINENVMLLDNTDRGISRELLYIGVREYLSTEFTKTFLKPGDICIDIGANIGYYALLEARLVGRNGRIFAIEPSRQNIELLNRNIKINQYNNIEPYRGAIGSEECLGFLKLSPNANQHSFVNQDPTSFSASVEEVNIMPLDTFLQDKPYPQFVRMDVEGYEGEVIKGMRNTLGQKKPLKMFIELHCSLLKDNGEELLRTLRDNGFIIRALFQERLNLLRRENEAIISLYDFLARNRFSFFNNSSANYDIPIDVFIQSLPKVKENNFRIFFERM
jgi:FkbM family methyltransferase